MESKVIEGTWEEVARRGDELAGRRVRVTVLDDLAASSPSNGMPPDAAETTVFDVLSKAGLIGCLKSDSNRLSEVIILALTEDPQTITRHNDRVVVLSAARYDELVGKKPDFKEFLLQGVGLDELDLTRDESPGRDVDL
jgi:prevent-host-death family protein